MPKVSIVITCHNHGRFLPFAIKSAISQTYKDFEVIAVDDGSTDNTAAVLVKYENDPRFTIIHQERKGPASARNLAIEQANGDFILPLDADDIIEKNMLEETVPVLEKNPDLGVAYTQWKTFGDVIKLVLPIEYNFLVLAYHANFIPGCSLYRKQAWKEAGGYNTDMEYGGEAWDLFVRMGEKGWCGGLVSKTLLMTRIHSESMQGLSDKHKQDIINQVVANNKDVYSKNVEAKDWFEAKQLARENRYPFSDVPIPELNDVLIKNLAWPKPASAPKVSIIIPCYNQADLLDEAVNSALCQTYQSFEIVIVNDGSTDNIGEALKKHANNPKIHIINQENQGVASARNNAILTAGGEYILPLDADDMIEPTYLEKTVASLDAEEKAGIAYTYIKFFGNAEREIQQIDFDFMVLAYHGNFMTCTSLFRKTAWEDAGGYNPNMRYGYEDWDLWLGISERGWGVTFVKEPLIHYRQTETSRSDEAHRHLPELYRQLIANHPITYAQPLAEKKWLRFVKQVSDETRFPIGNATSPCFQTYIDNIIFEPVDKPDVSVIITCDHRANTIMESVRSILFQDYRSFEIIIVDLGIAGDAKGELEKLKANPRVAIIDATFSRDLISSTSKAVSGARGKYILMLSNGDVVHKTLLSKATREFNKRTKLGIVYANEQERNGEEAARKIQYSYAALKRQNYIGRHAVFSKHAWLEAGGFKKETLNPDILWGLWLRMGDLGWAGKLIDEPLVLQ